MTPLQRFILRSKDEQGSYQRMSEKALLEKGLRISSQRLQQIATDPEPDRRLTRDMVLKLAAATGVRPMAITALEDQALFDTATTPITERSQSKDRTA